jgi:hypothetical protein
VVELEVVKRDQNRRIGTGGRHQRGVSIRPASAAPRRTIFRSIELQSDPKHTIFRNFSINHYGELVWTDKRSSCL